MKATSSTTTTTLALLSLAGAVVAQNNSSTGSNSDSPFIPSSGISTQCSTYLVNLDKNTELAKCSNSLLSATSLFSPSSGSSNGNGQDISSALNRLCSAQSSCNDDAIKQSLTWFSGNCTAELQAGNDIVKSNYDVLYVLSPFTEAVCSKDTSGKYCALQIGQASEPVSSSSSSNSTSSNTTAATPSGAQQLLAQTYEVPHIQISTLYVNLASAAKNALNRLRRRQNTDQTAQTVSANGDDAALMPNSTTFRATNLPFLFVSGDMTTSQLCTTCTKAILASYVGFETEFPYSTGLASSPILGGQSALWKDIGATCGSGFLSSITAQAGSTYTSGSIRTFGLSAAATIGATAFASIFLL